MKGLFQDPRPKKVIPRNWLRCLLDLYIYKQISKYKTEQLGNQVSSPLTGGGAKTKTKTSILSPNWMLTTGGGAKFPEVSTSLWSR